MCINVKCGSCQLHTSFGFSWNTDQAIAKSVMRLTPIQICWGPGARSFFLALYPPSCASTLRKALILGGFSGGSCLVTIFHVGFHSISANTVVQAFDRLRKRHCRFPTAPARSRRYPRQGSHLRTSRWNDRDAKVWCRRDARSGPGK